VDFYDHATTHDLTRRAGLTDDIPAAFYRQLQAAAYVERARGAHGMAVEFNRYQSELNWSLAERHYYKLWPAIIPLLAGVGIDVPVDYLRLPSLAFPLRFPMQDNLLRVDGQQRFVRSSSTMAKTMMASDACFCGSTLANYMKTSGRCSPTANATACRASPSKRRLTGFVICFNH
jgi:hypothetical protein